jgi:hypothetical protein
MIALVAGTVRFHLGDMFEGAADLIVLPCSTVPTVTEFVRERLRLFDIPLPEEPMRLGEVRIVPFRGAENVASYVAWAASVAAADYSTTEAVEAIGRAIGAFTREHPSVELVSAPLLGTGAGGLEGADAVERLRRGFLAEAGERATLQIFTLTQALFDELRARFEPAGTGPEDGSQARDEHIRVFVSYTRTSPEHAAWVRDLATFLRANGVNARLDQWHLRLGSDVAQWMTNELDQARRVLLICDERYAQKADRRHGGVGWEIRVVQGDMLWAPESDKYVAIVRTAAVEDGLPTFLKSSFFLHWPPSAEEAGLRDQLLRAIYDVTDEPPIGPPPIYLTGTIGRGT